MPYAECLGADVEVSMRQAEEAVQVELTSMDATMRDLAKKLYLLIVPACRGKALNICRKCEANNGFLVSKMLKAEYEPAVAGRHTSMLCGLLSPDWCDKNDRAKRDFLEMLQEWENGVAEYEKQSGGAISSNIRVATVLKHAPSEVRQALRMSAGSVKGDYALLRVVLYEYLQAGKSFDSGGFASSGDHSGPVAMDVGAIYDKGKGKGFKGKSKDNKGKGKGYGHQQGKGPKGQGKEGKGKAKSGKGKVPATQGEFQGYCGLCNVWGHKRADCPSRGTHAVTNAAQTPSVSGMSNMTRVTNTRCS